MKNFGVLALKLTLCAALMVVGLSQSVSNANAAFVFQAVVSGNDQDALDYLDWSSNLQLNYQFLAKKDMPNTVTLGGPATSFSVGSTRSETWTLGGTVADLALVKFGNLIAIYIGPPASSGSFNLDTDVGLTPTIWDKVSNNPLNFVSYTPTYNGLQPPPSLNAAVSHVSVYYRGGGAPVIPEPATMGMFVIGLMCFGFGPMARRRTAV